MKKNSKRIAKLEASLAELRGIVLDQANDIKAMTYRIDDLERQGGDDRRAANQKYIQFTRTLNDAAKQLRDQMGEIEAGHRADKEASDELGEQIEEFTSRQNAIEARMTGLEDGWQADLKLIHDRVAGLTKSVGSLYQAMESIRTDLNHHGRSITDVELDVQSLNKAVQQAAKFIGETREIGTIANSAVHACNALTVKLNSLGNDIQIIQDHFDDIEAYNNSVEDYNEVPAPPRRKK